MAKCVDNLPDELLIELLRWLPVSDLKSARLTCTRWSDIGATMLFRRIYFSPRKIEMEAFANITQHPLLRKGVRELIYDGRLFRHECLQGGEYIAAYDRYRGVYGSDDEDDQVWRNWHNLLDPRDPESLAKGLQGYACLFDEQEHILNSGHDYQSLLAGLERLPTLTTLRVQDDFYFGDWLPFYDDADDWYEEKTARDFVGVLPPSSWNPWRNTEAAAPEGWAWDCRGVSNLFKAVSRHCSNIKGLFLGSQASKAPLAFFHSVATIPIHIAELAPNLRVLKIDCEASTNDEDETVSQEISSLAAMASQAKTLEALSTSMGVRGDRWLKVILGPVWPQLRVLDIGDIRLTQASFVAIVRPHRATLSQLKLRNICLLDDLEESWIELGEKLGQLVKLDSILLSGLVSEALMQVSDGPYLATETTLEVAKKIMKWVARPELLTNIHPDMEAQVMAIRKTAPVSAVFA